MNVNNKETGYKPWQKKENKYNLIMISKIMWKVFTIHGK